VLELNPRYFVFENVKGLTVGQHRKFLDELVEAFDASGYTVLKPYCVLNASEHGVPQHRHRLFLIGARRGQAMPRYPERSKEAVTVWDALSDVPEAENYPELIERDWVKAEYEQPSAYARALRLLDNAAPDFGYRREFDRELLTSSLRAEHTPLSRKRFAATGHGETEPVSRFLKLDPKGVCNTLRAGTASDRGAFTSPRPIHPYTPRCITVREAARLHSYPDWFRFHVTKWHGFRQIGNSVPPYLARAVGGEIVRALELSPVAPSEILRTGNEEWLSFRMSEAAEFFGVPSSVIGKRTRLIKEEGVYA
jgi:DNA (cytosine-5)-methyltransferase 1